MFPAQYFKVLMQFRMTLNNFSSCLYNLKRIYLMIEESEVLQQDLNLYLPLFVKEFPDSFDDPSIHLDDSIPKQIQHPSTFIQDQEGYPSSSLQQFLNIENPQSEVEFSTKKLFGQERDYPEELNEANQIQEENPGIPKQNGRKKKVKKQTKESRSNCKNFLATMKKLVLKCYCKHKGKKDDQNSEEMPSQKSSNKRDFELMFKRKDMKVFFGRLFLEKGLQRELQYSRIDSENRMLFIRKIKLLTKAFTEEKLPNL